MPVRSVLPFPNTPYVTPLRAFLSPLMLLQPLELISLHQCCLLWNWYETSISFSDLEEQNITLSLAQKISFLAALDDLNFNGIKVSENVIDYLLDFLLFPRLEGIPL